MTAVTAMTRDVAIATARDMARRLNEANDKILPHHPEHETLFTIANHGMLGDTADLLDSVANYMEREKVNDVELFVLQDKIRRIAEIVGMPC